MEPPLGAMGVFLQTRSFTEPGALTREGQQKEMAIKELQDMAIQRATQHDGLENLSPLKYGDIFWVSMISKT